MASAKDFNKLGTIEGVSHFILVRNDGHVVAHNTDKAGELSSTIVMGGRNCNKLQDYIDCGQSSHLCVERTNGSNYMVFTLGNYFLGILQDPDYDSQTTAEAVINYLKTI